MLNNGIDDFFGYHNYACGQVWCLRENEDVKTKVRKEIVPNEPYPLLTKEYFTPKGTLKQVVRQTTGIIRPGHYHWNNWPHGDDIPIFSDHTIPNSRSKRHLVESMEDLEPLSCLLRNLTNEEREFHHEYAEKVKHFAEDNEVLIASFGPNLTDALSWVCGIENVITLSYKNPTLLHRLLDIIHVWDMKSIRLILELGGGDLIINRAWYGNGLFWPSKKYRQFIMPRIQEEIALVHQAGIKFCYLLDTGIMPLLNIFKEMGVDVLWGVDPLQGGADLSQIKEEVGDRMCLLGGMNSAITLGYGTNDEVKKAVKEAISTLAPGGGFILAPTNGLFDDAPSENVETLIKTWHEMSTYPIR